MLIYKDFRDLKNVSNVALAPKGSCVRAALTSSESPLSTAPLKATAFHITRSSCCGLQTTGKPGKLTLCELENQ